MRSKEEIEEARIKKLEKKEERRLNKLDRKRRHRLAIGTCLFNDHTYSTIDLDIDQDTSIEWGGLDYVVPDIPYEVTGWWPFKARTFKRIFIKDKHYNIDWLEGNPVAVSITSAHETAEHKYILPSTFKAMLLEKGQANMFMSMKKKNKLPISAKWIILIVIIVIAILFILLFSGVFHV